MKHLGSLIVVVSCVLIVLLRSRHQTIDKVSLCVTPRKRLHIYMITLPRDQWKRDRFQNSMNLHAHQFDYKQWEGVMVRETPEILQWALDNKLGHVKNDKLKGNIGSALAHISLWDFVAKHDDDECFLVFEDNALVKEQSKKALLDMQDLDFDMVNLRVLRPRGRRTNREGLLRVKYDPFWTDWLLWPAPNVWLSSYLLTPRGARQLLEYFKEHNFDLSNTIVDRAVSKAISSDRTEKMKMFVVDHDRYFGHEETKGDTRGRENK